MVGAGMKGAGGSDPPAEGGYHYVFMPSHLFPAYPSYRWWAVIVDRSVLVDHRKLWHMSARTALYLIPVWPTSLRC